MSVVHCVIGTHQHPVPLPLLHLPLQARTNHLSQLWVEGLHHQISQNLYTHTTYSIYTFNMSFYLVYFFVCESDWIVLD